MNKHQTTLIDRLLSVIENDIIPLTQIGVKSGNKVFGAAILRKDDLSLVIAATNTETENPLWHGEMAAMKKLYEMPAAKRPAPKDCIFLATHEPCSLCLSAITWGGYDNFYYLFSYVDSRDQFKIPHDLNILKEVFRCDHGAYNKHNHYWNAYDIPSLMNEFKEPSKKNLWQRIDNIKQIYNEMSDIYQASKINNDIPLN